MKSISNQIKTVALLAAIGALFLWIGNALGGQPGMITALLLSLAMNAGAYWFSDKVVLAMHGAKQLQSNDPYGISAMVSELAAKAEIPMPKVYLIEEGAPNAFATGRDPSHSAVAVTTGLLTLLNERELRGVLAHELGHIKNRDILISTIVACFASAVMYLAHMLQWFGAAAGHSREGERHGTVNPIVLLFTVLVAPVIATLVQMAVSRTREYMADESGAGIAEDPEALASALEKISNPDRVRQFQREDRVADMQPAFAHLYIVNHFSNESVLSWFSTHPPVKDRVRKLRALSGQKV